MVIFVGGIHGSGKGTICRELSSKTSIPHFSSSEILKWEDVSPNVTNKKVGNIADTQLRLINGLKETIRKHPKIILDGHFCLFDKNGNVKKIDFSTFELINPSFIVIVQADIADIQQRLYLRDLIDYKYADLDRMQNLEIEYSKQVAISLNIPYFQIDLKNLPELITLITESL